MTTVTDDPSTWRIGHDWEAFSAVARDFLEAEPERNTLPITVLDAVVSGRFREPPPTFGWKRHAASVQAAFLVTPPHELIVVGRPVLAASLGKRLRDDGFAVSGVNAEPDVAAAFCSTYLEHSQATAEERMRMLLYRLEGLVEPPVPAYGSARLAEPEHFDLCLDWFNEMHTGAAGDQSDLVHRRIAGGLIWLWEADEEFVSMAGRAPDSAGVARIGPVYTPPRWRRRGFASAVTHACARDALERGASGVALFTDLANPTSNAIYQAIGFRQIAERAVMAFAAAKD